jgi:hypothetical protein
MADQTFMFMTTAGTMIALTVLLFVSKGRRTRAARSVGQERTSPSSLPPSSSSSHDDRKSNDKIGGRNKAKKYTSDGKPVYED